MPCSRYLIAQQHFEAVTDHSLSFLALDESISAIIILIAMLHVSNFTLNIVGNLVVALCVLLDGTASLGDATREDFLAFGEVYAGRRGVGTFVVRSEVFASKMSWSVMVLEEKVCLKGGSVSHSDLSANVPPVFPPHPFLPAPLLLRLLVGAAAPPLGIRPSYADFGVSVAC